MGQPFAEKPKEIIVCVFFKVVWKIIKALRNAIITKREVKI